MEFCPKCGSRLEPKKAKKDKEFSLVLECPKCGYKKSDAKKIGTKAVKVINHDPEKTFTIISKEDQKLRTLPTLKVECPKCGNNLVYVWQVQTRGGDESSTQFMRCTKCDHTFREYT